MASDHPVVQRVEGPADAGYLDAVHEALARLWSLAAVADEDRMLFELAVAEVAGNIVQHATSASGAVEVRLDLQVSDDDLVAVFRDSADPPVLDLSAVSMPDAGAEAGRGLAIALAALDDLEHEPHDGNVWRLRRRRRDADAG